MALDLAARPVRLDSPSIRTIRYNAESWDIAIGHAPFSSLPRESLPEINRQILADHPGGFGKTFPFPDRSYQQAEFLLDPVGYRNLTGWEQRERSFPFRVIQGDEYFAKRHAMGGQGVPWRCSTVGFLAQAADAIDTIDEAAVRREFSVAAMVAECLYKVRATEDDDAAFQRVLTGLRALASYYHRIADAGLDLIITRD